MVCLTFFEKEMIAHTLIFLWTDMKKVELFERCVLCYIWHYTNTISEKKKKNMFSKHNGGGVIVWNQFFLIGMFPLSEL